MNLSALSTTQIGIAIVVVAIIVSAGIAPENAPNHPWAGVTRFKLGFGGRAVDYPGTFDLPLNRLWYTLYSLVRRARP